MSKLKDMVGFSSESFTVTSRADNNKTGQAMWYCVCGNCSQQSVQKGNDLRAGRVKSCGCLRVEGLVERSTIHGNAGRHNVTGAYESWRGMKERCTNPNNKLYYRYGGRGITFCEEWSTFENFLKDMGDRPKDLTIERIDNSLGYFKENCKWATRLEQAQNKG